MNPRPKTEQRVAETCGHGEPAAVFRHAGGKSLLKGAGELSILERFLGTDFRRGTIVDYAHGTGFRLECRRNTIDGFFIEGNQITITSGRLAWMHEYVGQLRIEERGGVFHVSGPDFPDCAIAPMGVEIPKKETFVEAIDDSVRLLEEGRARGKTEEAAKPAATKKFRATDFSGGTLVEYTDAFCTEFSRGKVTRFSIHGDRLMVVTDGKAMLGYPDLGELRIEERDGVFLIYGNYCSCFALAPKGVEIAKNTAPEEIEDAKEVLAGRRE